MSVDKSRKPYHDDYDESKNYHEMLFRPSNALQVRELNQLQSMFHTQIRRFGSSIYKNGSVVIPGSTAYDNSYPFVVVTIDNLASVKALLQNKNNTVVGDNTGLVANITEVIFDGTKAVLYVSYTNGGTGGAYSVFSAGETLRISDGTGVRFATGVATSTGTGSRFTVNEGVYYVDGRFIATATQSIILDMYSNKPSYSVGFIVNEVEVTTAEDSSLFDNASGTSNFAAPGANRLRIDMLLTKIDVTANSPENFVEIFRVENGDITGEMKSSQYSNLADMLARRTYDESGDYTVRNFAVQVRDHLKSDKTPSGVFTATEGGDADKFVVSVGNGKAYVRGYEIENMATKNLPVYRARDFKTYDNAVMTSQFGYYIEVSSFTGTPDITTFMPISLRNTEGYEIGTARVASVINYNGIYRVYLFDIRNSDGRVDTSFISFVKTLYYKKGAVAITGTVNGTAALKDTSDEGFVFKLPVTNVKSLINPSLNKLDTTMQVLVQRTGKVNSEGKVTIFAGTDESFVGQNPSYTSASYTDVSDGMIANAVDKMTLSGTPVGSTVTLDLGVDNASRPVTLTLLCVKENPSYKTKLPTDDTITVAEESHDHTVSLKKADVYRINSVLDKDGVDVTNQFNLLSNKQKTYYGISYLKPVAGAVAINYPLTVSFTYFQHGHGDFFCVDSYKNIDYVDIPVEDGLSMCDALDFRPRISDANDGFTGIGANVSELPIPGSIITTDANVYLPRRDKVFLKSTGEFGVLKGEPSLNPKYPDDLVNSMTLYTLDIPAYTDSINDIKITANNNRRYTMSDIGKLDRRISNLEYYVTLNMLEKDAESTQEYNTDGSQRYKNGFVVDSFNNHNISDYSDSEYHCSIGDSELRPEFSLNNVGVKTIDKNGIKIKNGIALLDYDDVELIASRYSTRYIPLTSGSSASWSPYMTLTPAATSLFDDTVGMTTLGTDNNGDSLNQNWNMWQKHWSGVSRDTVENASESDNAFSRYSNNESISTSVSVSTSDLEAAGDRMISRSATPRPAAVDITINGTGFKPNTRLYFFFDFTTDITKYTGPAVEGFASNTAVLSDTTGKFSATVRLPKSMMNNVVSGTHPISVCDAKDGVRANASCYVIEYFTITGAASTSDEAQITTRQTVSDVNEDANPMAQIFTVDSHGGCFTTGVDLFFRSKDDTRPVNIDIREVENGIPTNRIVANSKVTLSPSDIKINTTVGYAGRNVEKGDKSSFTTTVEFQVPVYLQNNTQYALVITSFSDKYSIYACKDREEVETDRIATYSANRQPNVGNIYHRQSDGTWLEDPDVFLTLSIKKAQFKVSSGSLALTHDTVSELPLSVNAFSVDKGSSFIRVAAGNHNQVKGAIVSFKNVDFSSQGFNDESMNTGTFTVTDVISNGYFMMKSNVSAATAPTSTVFGGSNVKLVASRFASLFNFNATDIRFPDTSLDYTLKAAYVKDNAIPYVEGDSVSIRPNENIPLDHISVLATDVDSAKNYEGKPSTRITANFSTYNENISPVLDLQRASIVAPLYRIGGLYAEYNKYITKVIPLSEAADTVKTYLDVKCPDGSDVILQARIGNSAEEVNNSAWLPMKVNASSIVGSDFVEREFSTGIISNFSYFQLRIILKSDTAASIPICKRMRTLALSL